MCSKYLVRPEGPATLTAFPTRSSMERNTSLDRSSTSRRDQPSTMAVTRGVTATIISSMAATPMAMYLISGWRKEMLMMTSSPRLSTTAMR